MTGEAAAEVTRWWRLTWDDGEDGAPAATGFVEEVVGVRCSVGKVEKDLTDWKSGLLPVSCGMLKFGFGKL